MAEPDRRSIRTRFLAAVNMSPDELEAWLETADCKRVGFKRDGAKTDSDYAHMRKVAGFVARHRAQEPANIVTSRLPYSLMNWGHDPLK